MRRLPPAAWAGECGRNLPRKRRWPADLSDLLELPAPGVVPEFARGIRRPHGRKATSSAADAAENAITPAPPRTPLQIAAGLASLNLDRIVDVVLHELAPALGARRASVYAMQRDRQILSLLRHTHGYPIDPVVAIARAVSRWPSLPPTHRRATPPAGRAAANWPQPTPPCRALRRR